MEQEIALTIELRVLHGPQSGSRLQLGTGEYLLGSGDECAIILAGPRIESEHASIAYDGDEIRIRPLNGSVSDAQGNDIESETVLALGMPIELGGVWLAVDRTDAPWPSDEAVRPVSPRAWLGQRRTVEPGNTEEADPNADNDTETGTAEASSEQVESERQAEPAAEIATTPVGRRWALPAPKRAALVLGLLAFPVLIIVAAVMWIGSIGTPPEQQIVRRPEPEPPAKRVPPPALVALIAKNGWADRLKVVGDAGEWVVEGYLPSGAALSALNAALQDLEQRPLLRIVNEEELVAAANRYLARRNVPSRLLLRAENAGSGTIRLTGAAATDEAVAAASEALRASVPGIVGVESAVLQREQLVLRLREQLSTAGLADRIKTVDESPELVLQGTLTAEETTRWETLLVQFARDYGSVLAIRAQIGRVRPRMPVNVQAIVGGRTPYIVTDRGEKVNTGGDINGHTLLTVRDAEVVFEGSRRVRMAR